MWSLYPGASARLLIDDVKQLPPNAFGNAEMNLFQEQYKISLLQRMIVGGFNVHKLKVTKRFKNESLLAICRIVNCDNSIQEAPDCFQPKWDRIMKNHNKEEMGVEAPVAFIHVHNNWVQTADGGSRYSKDTATVTIRNVLQFLKRGATPELCTIITPYTAQVNLLRRMVQQADGSGITDYPFVWDKLRKVTIKTIDSYMGNENRYVWVDTCGHPGHLLDDVGDPGRPKEYPRTVVAFTRATSGMVVVGEWNHEWQRKHGSNHPYIRMVKYMIEKRFYVQVVVSGGGYRRLK